MKRSAFRRDGLALSYLDAGGAGPILIALHAHWMEAVTFTTLAEALAPSWRVVALDQRGHGHSDHAPSYTRDNYVADLVALLDHLGVDRAAFLGNSLGGVNAYQLAARHPDRVSALIVEDIGVVLTVDVSFTLAWGGTFPTRDALAERVGGRMMPYLQHSFRQTAEGWQLAFNPQEMVVSQHHLNGNHWADWLASTCPALLIRGRTSHVTTQLEIDDMATRRRNTSLVTLEAGHVVHQDTPTAFAAYVTDFLRGNG